MELNQQDWDLIEDDGFVRRRLKRTRLDPTTVTAAPSDPPPDPAAEAITRRERKKTILLKLKEKYQKEIDQWGILSNTLQALQNQPFPAIPPATNQPISDLPESSSEGIHRELTDTLLAKVEAQEVFIAEASRLCDVVEALCDTEEQRLKQPFFDLPIWEPSPKDLMSSLLEE